MSQSNESLQLKHCVKCDQEGTLSGLDPKKATYCEPCFIKTVKHKFGSSIGKRRLFKDGNRREVLLVYEGDSSSAFLLSLISQGLKAEANKRLTLIPTVLVLLTSVNESCIDNAIETIDSFKGVISGRWIFIHIASIFEPIIFDEATRICGRHLLKTWSALLASCSSSVRLELTGLVRELLVVRVARALGIDKVMTADCAEILAKKALTSLAFARGSLVSQLTDVVDKRFGDVSIIRPLRDVCLKEISILNRFEGNDKYTIFAPTNLSIVEKSVQSVTSDFLEDQIVEGFKGVLTTILSTSAKLRCLSTEKYRCLLCFAPASDEEEEHRRLCRACSIIMNEIPEKNLVEKIIFTAALT